MKYIYRDKTYARPTNMSIKIVQESSRPSKTMMQWFTDNGKADDYKYGTWAIKDQLKKLNLRNLKEIVYDFYRNQFEYDVQEDEGEDVLELLMTYPDNSFTIQEIEVISPNNHTVSTIREVCWYLIDQGFANFDKNWKIQYRGKNVSE